MDNKLFDIFSEETEVPECVLRRVDETLEMIENSAESDRGYQKEEKTGKVINGTDRMGKIGTRKNWKRSLRRLQKNTSVMLLSLQRIPWTVSHRWIIRMTTIMSMIMDMVRILTVSC